MDRKDVVKRLVAKLSNIIHYQEKGFSISRELVSELCDLRKVSTRTWFDAIETFERHLERDGSSDKNYRVTVTKHAVHLFLKEKTWLTKADFSPDDYDLYDHPKDMRIALEKVEAEVARLKKVIQENRPELAISGKLCDCGPEEACDECAYIGNHDVLKQLPY